ncbi:MAG: HRDC domain-containing protein, partial [Thermoplasmata archaeon]|nr:HRDC domain-containing protein [Thermoplasmata archaeon]
GADIRLGHINTASDADDITQRSENLRVWRRAKSDETGFPLYIVLQNKTIEDLAVKNPQTLEDLKDIFGIGEVKVANYGQEILEVLSGEGSPA